MINILNVIFAVLLLVIFYTTATGNICQIIEFHDPLSELFFAISSFILAVFLILSGTTIDNNKEKETRDDLRSLDRK